MAHHNPDLLLSEIPTTVPTEGKAEAGPRNEAPPVEARGLNSGEVFLFEETIRQ